MKSGRFGRGRGQLGSGKLGRGGARLVDENDVDPLAESHPAEGRARGQQARAVDPAQRRAGNLRAAEEPRGEERAGDDDSQPGGGSRRQLVESCATSL